MFAVYDGWLINARVSYIFVQESAKPTITVAAEIEQQHIYVIGRHEVVQQLLWFKAVDLTNEKWMFSLSRKKSSHAHVRKTLLCVDHFRLADAQESLFVMTHQRAIQIDTLNVHQVTHSSTIAPPHTASGW